MPQLLRLLSVSFDTHVPPWELPQFRAAIAHKVGLEHEWFHNHDNESGGYHIRYPLIQYHTDRRGEQMQPSLICLQAGVEEAHHFFSQPDWNVRLGQRDLSLRIARLDMQQYHLRLDDKPRQYRLHHWKPFNSDNYRHYTSLRGIVEQCSFLEGILLANILTFASGVDWQIDERFPIKITQILKTEWMEYKGVKFLGFSLDFETPLVLPPGIGLGKAVSMGFGVVRNVRMR
jgi:hypothetical protein